MAQLTVDQRKAIERWAGTLTDEQTEEAMGRLSVLGRPEVVAFEILSIRMADLLASPDELRIEGDARVRWVEAKKQLQNQINLCADAIGRLPVVLNLAARDVMGPYLASHGGTKISATRYWTLNQRP